MNDNLHRLYDPKLKKAWHVTKGDVTIVAFTTVLLIKRIQVKYLDNTTEWFNASGKVTELDLTPTILPSAPVTMRKLYLWTIKTTNGFFELYPTYLDENGLTENKQHRFPDFANMVKRKETMFTVEVPDN